MAKKENSDFKSGRSMMPPNGDYEDTKPSVPETEGGELLDIRIRVGDAYQITPRRSRTTSWHVG